jgi:hypothetical protein
LGFEDEAWFSRFERPSMHSWADAQKPARLLEKEARKDDPEPKALSCYGLYLPELEETWLRFVDGRPVSPITTQFLSWCCHRLGQRGKEALLLISGTTQAGTKAERSKAGSPRTTAVSKPAAVGSG